MDFRSHTFTSNSQSKLIPTLVETHVPPGHPAPTASATAAVGPRPLSDIRELSEPSLIDALIQRPNNAIKDPNTRAKKLQTSISHADALREQPLLKRSHSSRRPHQPARAPLIHTRPHSADATSSSSYSNSTPERSSFYSIPHSSIPRRSSSQGRVRARGGGTVRNHARKPSIRTTPPPPPPQPLPPPNQPAFEGLTIPNHGPGRSPVKDSSQRYNAVWEDRSRRAPSRTQIRMAQSTDILEFPTYRHPRVKLELRVSAPLFVGGGSIEGQVKITVDENEKLRSRRSLALGAISVDLVGFEDVDAGRKASFLAVGTELIDIVHPPPSNMVEPPNPLMPDEKFWTLSPSTSALPFVISLPLDTGAPPFQSKHASIRFLLCATALIRDAGKLYRVRVSQDVNVIATYDPEKALTSLPSPLTATDELTLRHFGRCENVILTAGLHRQVWVSGSSIFVDVHIANKSHRPVRKLELSLERDILCYKHAPAATREKSASQARIFESNERTVITRITTKASAPQQTWTGVEPHTSETRTWELELPRSHATIRCGKFFEVRFFLNVSASLSNNKSVAVQLPITLIHINSLDVLPNCVAQVAAAIEEKRSNQPHGHRRKHSARLHGHTRQRSASSPAAMVDMRRQPSYSQGRAFAAPRQQSIDRQRAQRRDMEDLRDALDSSPRKFQPQLLRGAEIRKMDSNISFRSIGTCSEEKKVSERTRNPFLDWTPGVGKTPGLSAGWKEGRKEDREKSRGVRDEIKRMSSFPTAGSRKSPTPSRRDGPPAFGTTCKAGPPYNFTVVHHHTGHHRIQPHVLGLSSPADDEADQPSSMRKVPERPATGLGFRERMERSRFEVKGVRRKGSGRSVRDRGLGLWEHVKGLGREKGKEGWI